MRLGHADLPNAPAAVAGAATAAHFDFFPAQIKRAGPVDILRGARQIHHHARALAACEARLFNGFMARRGGQAAAQAAFIIGQCDAGFAHRFDNFDSQRPDGQGKSVTQHFFGGAQIILPPLIRQRKTGIHNVQLRIDAERSGEEDRAVGAIAIKEKAVIKIAVAARIGHRLGRLVQRIIIGWCQHLLALFLFAQCRAHRRFVFIRAGQKRILLAIHER